jgi:hypothetical protein
MDYLVTLLAVLLWFTLLWSQLKVRKNIAVVNIPVNHTSESIIASMYVYWKRRIDNAASVDEGADCLINAGTSAEQFRELVDQSLGIKTEKQKEAEAIAKSSNIILLWDE